MRVLLVEEYSAYHKYLKEGLKALGHIIMLFLSRKGVF